MKADFGDTVGLNTKYRGKTMQKVHFHVIKRSLKRLYIMGMHFTEGRRMRKRTCMLWAGVILAILLLLVGGTAMAEDQQIAATSTDLEPEPVPDFVVEGDVLTACNSEAYIVSVPAGVRVIGPNAFRGKQKLQSVVIPDSVEVISAGAFAECTKLKLVILGENSKLKEIGSKAFLNCKNLTRLNIPASVTYIAFDAFDGCDKLVIYAPQGSTAISLASRLNIKYQVTQ
jgi:hypothetical protein